MGRDKISSAILARDEKEKGSQDKTAESSGERIPRVVRDGFNHPGKMRMNSPNRATGNR